jgi:UDP-N-acetylmuramoyl-tripeptide--D-alanyl-D-alanine ligase
MVIWTAETAAEATNGVIFSKWQGNKLVFDSRLIEEGDIFLALPGTNSDGHAHVKQALEKGAAAAIVSKIPEDITNRPLSKIASIRGFEGGLGSAQTAVYKEVHEDSSTEVAHKSPTEVEFQKKSNKDKLLLVDDVGQALSALAAYKRLKSSAKFIAVTGSVGKTSTKELLYLAFNAQGKSFASRGNYNNYLGVPINLASMPDDIEFAIIEIGMDHAGEITPLTKLVKPNMMVITNIEHIHRANFPSIDGIAEAKAEIFSGSLKEGVAIINSLSNCYSILRDQIHHNVNISKTITLGIDSNIIEYSVHNNQTYAKLNILGQIISLNIPNILGIHQIYNMVTALTCVAQFGLDPLISAKALENFKLPRGRGLVMPININGKLITLIDDSYNAGPISIQAALRNMSHYSGRKVAILGDMTEMGEESLAIHLALKQDILNNKIDKVICFGEQMGQLHQTLTTEIQLGNYLTLAELAKDLPNKLIDGDILLIKGSHYLTNLYGFTKHLIDNTLHSIK